MIIIVCKSTAVTLIKGNGSTPWKSTLLGKALTSSTGYYQKQQQNPHLFCKISHSSDFKHNTAFTSVWTMPIHSIQTAMLSLKEM